MSDKQKRFLIFGAHPDDPDLLFGGTAYRLSQAGHVVKFVSMTNGNSGHYNMDKDALALRRAGEAQASAKILGISEYEIFPLNDGELEPTVENRKRVIRCIRKFRPDVVISHRTCDYHPDHRAAGQLVLDAAYLLSVPLTCPETPVPDNLPIFAYTFDRFTRPAPIRADAAVEMDSVREIKCRALACHRSQFFEWLPYGDGMSGIDFDAMDWPARFAHLGIWLKRFEKAAELSRETLRQIYGDRADSIRTAEVFEQSDYSFQVPQEEFARLFLP